MKIHQDAPAEEVQIQLIPLIDVIFCILTFFILAALQLTRQQGIEVDLPKASTGSSQMREMLVVTINPTGLVYLDRNPQPVDRAQLYQSLQAYRQSNPTGLLVLNASRMAFYNDVVQILDTMRAVGGDRVALATLPADPAQPGNLAPGNLAPGNPSLTPVPTITPTALPLPINPTQPAPGGALFPPLPPATPVPQGAAPERVPTR
jgi:biopolymer transport protein ExbD